MTTMLAGLAEAWANLSAWTETSGTSSTPSSRASADAVNQRVVMPDLDWLDGTRLNLTNTATYATGGTVDRVYIDLAQIVAMNVDDATAGVRFYFTVRDGAGSGIQVEFRLNGSGKPIVAIGLSGSATFALGSSTYDAVDRAKVALTIDGTTDTVRVEVCPLAADPSLDASWTSIGSVPYTIIGGGFDGTAYSFRVTGWGAGPSTATGYVGRINTTDAPTSSAVFGVDRRRRVAASRVAAGRCDRPC